MIQRIQSFPMVEKFKSLEDVEKYLERLRVSMTEDQYLRNYDIDVDTTGASHYKFKTITGITNDVVADQMEDTLTLASGNATLGIVGTAATDTITFTWAHLGLQSLADPNADRIFFWDDSDGAAKWLAPTSALSITTTALNVLYDGTTIGLDGSNRLYAILSGLTHNLFSATHPDTVAASPVLGDIPYGNVTPAWTKLAGNITTTKKFLTQTGTGAVSAAPSWGTIDWADVSKVGSNLNEIVTRSHTVLSDIGTLTHATIDGYLDQAVKALSSPTFAGLTLTGFSGIVKATVGALSAAALTDADIPDTITLTNITQITNRSHASLSDIGSLSHATIDSYLDQSVKIAASPTFVQISATGDVIGDSDGNAIYIGGTTASVWRIDRTATMFRYLDNLGNYAPMACQYLLTTDSSAVKMAVGNVSGIMRFQSDGTNIRFLNSLDNYAPVQCAGIDAAGTVQCDSFRIDQTPTAGTFTPDKYVTMNFNGVSYKVACLAA